MKFLRTILVIKKGISMINILKKLFGNENVEEVNSESLVEVNGESLLVKENCISLIESVKEPSKIREICFEGNNISMIPDDIVDFIRLSRLEICETPNLTELPLALEKLKFLNEVVLINSGLKSLPANIFNNAKDIYIQDWLSKDFPLNICFNEKLIYLNINGGNIEKIPDEIKNLNELQSLTIEGCEYLLEISNAIGELESLKELVINANDNLSSIPEDICKLRNLQSLAIRYSPYLTKIPENIGQLVNLKELDLRRNQLSELPKSITKLKKLEKLYIQEDLDIPWRFKEMEKSGQLKIDLI